VLRSRALADLLPAIDSVLPVISLVAAVCSSSDDVGEAFCCRSFWASSYETTCVNGCGGCGCGGFPPRDPFAPAGGPGRFPPLELPLPLVDRLCWGGLPRPSAADRLASILSVRVAAEDRFL